MEGTYHSVFDIVNMFVAILVAKYFVVWNGIMAEHWCWNKELQEMNRGYVQETNQTTTEDLISAMNIFLFKTSYHNFVLPWTLIEDNEV